MSSRFLGHAGRAAILTLRLLKAACKGWFVGVEQSRRIRVEEGDVKNLWRKVREAGGPEQVVVSCVGPASWSAVSRGRALLFMRQIGRLKVASDAGRVIRQRCEIGSLQQPGRQDRGLLQASWQLWREEVLLPAVQLLRGPVQAFASATDETGKGMADLSGCKVAIVGWYGSETLGDYAILAEILVCLRQQGFSDRQVAVFGSEPRRTRLTLEELGRAEVSSLSLFGLLGRPEQLNKPGIYIFGGGPLCDGRPMVEVAQVLEQAAGLGRQVFLWGVGIGPLTEPLYWKAVRRMLNGASRIAFRDEASRFQAAAIIAPRADQAVATLPDPSAAYLRRCAGECPAHNFDEPYFLFAGRPLSRRTTDVLSEAEFCQTRQRFDEQVLKVLTGVAACGTRIRLVAHEYWPEDDREYLAGLLAELPSASGVEMIETYLDVEESINLYCRAAGVIAVRFHAAVFAIALNKPFVAVDYIWGGGKTLSLLADVGLDDRGYGVADFLQAEAGKIVDKLYDSRIDWDRVNAEQTEGLKRYDGFFFG